MMIDTLLLMPSSLPHIGIKMEVVKLSPEVRHQIRRKYAHGFVSLVWSNISSYLTNHTMGMSEIMWI